MVPDERAGEEASRSGGRRREPWRSGAPRGPGGGQRPRRRSSRGRASAGPKRPELPAALEPDVPRSVVRELQRNAREPDAVAKALTLAADAIQADEPEGALPYLEWAKSAALRSPSVREALGVARYLAGDWQGALLELQAYRRLSGRNDQNHLIADCLRGLGRPPAKVAELVREMDREGSERVAEGAIVWASAVADHGDAGAGRTLLRRYLETLPTTQPPEPYELRLWYVAGDLAERDGDARDAERWFRRVTRADPDAFDARERLSALES